MSGEADQEMREVPPPAPGQEPEVEEEEEGLQAIAERQKSGGMVMSFDVGGRLVDDEGKDIRKVHDTEEGARRSQAWRGEEAATDDQTAIPFDSAIDSLDHKIKSMMLASDLRFYIVFIICFCFFFLIGRNISDNYYFTKAFRDPLLGTELWDLKVAKFFDDLSDASEFERWARGVALGELTDESHPTGGNILIGALRLRTQRVRKDSCEINSHIIPDTMPASAKECYGKWSDSNSDDGFARNRYNQVERWRYKSCEDMDGGSRTSGIVAWYNCGGYFFTVPFWRPITAQPSKTHEYTPFPSDVWERVPYDVADEFYMKPAFTNDPPFIDNLATRFVILEFFAYNPTLDTFLSVKMFAEEAAGGLWVPSYQFRIFEVFKSDGPGISKLIFDVFFGIFVLYYVFDFFRDLLKFRRETGKVLAFFFSTWNFLELLNLSIFVAVYGFRISWWVLCSQNQIDLTDITFKNEYPVVLDDILSFYMLQVYLNSVNTVLSFLKLLKFFRLNDRLNILTRTMSECQDSIIGVLFIFFLVVTAFAMTGHGLFGLGVWAFRSVDQSFSTLLLMLLGVFNYEELKNENRVLAGFFFWGYIILALFCLLNFLIGVLMEAFAEVSATRTVLPLEDVLVKSWADLKKMLHPSNIKKQIIRKLKWETTEYILEEALVLLRHHREEMFPEDGVDIPERENQMLSHADYKEAVSEPMDTDEEELARKKTRVRNLLGEKYIEFVWTDLVYEYDRSAKADEAIEAQRNLEMTQRGVKDCIGEHLEMIENFPQRMQELENSLNKLLGMLAEGN